MGNTQSVQNDSWKILGKESEHIPGHPVEVSNHDGFMAHLYEVQIPEDNSFDAELQSYERRKSSVSGSLVHVYDTIVRQQFFQCSGSKRSVSVITEYIPTRLSDYENLSVDEGVYVLEGALSGFQEIQEQTNSFFFVKSKMIGFNQEGKVKTWINEDFSSNQFSQRKINLPNQREMIKELVNCIQGKMASESQLEKIVGRKGMESFVCGRNQCNAYLSVHNRSGIAKSFSHHGNEKIGREENIKIQKFGTIPQHHLLGVNKAEEPQFIQNPSRDASKSPFRGPLDFSRNAKERDRFSNEVFPNSNNNAVISAKPSTQPTRVKVLTRDGPQRISNTNDSASPFKTPILFNSKAKDKEIQSNEIYKNIIQNTNKVVLVNKNPTPAKKSLPPIIKEERIPLFIREREAKKPIQVRITMISPPHQRKTPQIASCSKTPTKVKNVEPPAPQDVLQMQNIKKIQDQKKGYNINQLSSKGNQNKEIKIFAKQNMLNNTHQIIISPKHTKNSSSNLPTTTKTKVEKKPVSNLPPSTNPITIKVPPRASFAPRVNQPRPTPNPESRAVRIFTKHSQMAPTRTNISFCSPTHVSQAFPHPHPQSRTETFQTRQEIKSMSFHDQPKSDHSISHQLYKKAPTFIIHRKQKPSTASHLPENLNDASKDSKIISKREFISKITDLAILPTKSKIANEVEHFDQYENRPLTGIQQQYKSQFIDGENQQSSGTKENSKNRMEKDQQCPENSNEVALQENGAKKAIYENIKMGFPHITKTISSRSESQATLQHQKNLPKPSEFKEDPEQQLQISEITENLAQGFTDFKSLYAKLAPPQNYQEKKEETKEEYIFQKLQITDPILFQSERQGLVERIDFSKSQNHEEDQKAFYQRIESEKKKRNIFSQETQLEGVKFEINEESAKKLANLLAQHQENAFEENQELEDLENLSSEEQFHQKKHVLDPALQQFMDCTPVQN